MLEARSRFPAVAVEVTEAATRKTASDRQHLHTAGVVGGYIQDGLVISMRFLLGVSLVMLSFLRLSENRRIVFDRVWVLPQGHCFKGVVGNSRKDFLI